MNWRAIGCGTLAVAVFLSIGVWGILRAVAPGDCPESLPYQPAAFERVGEPMSSPALDGAEPLVHAGRAGFGLASWPVWVEPAQASAPLGDALPPRIVLECGGAFQAYEQAGGE